MGAYFTFCLLSPVVFQAQLAAGTNICTVDLFANRTATCGVSCTQCNYVCLVADNNADCEGVEVVCNTGVPVTFSVTANYSKNAFKLSTIHCENAASLFLYSRGLAGTFNRAAIYAPIGGPLHVEIHEAQSFNDNENFIFANHSTDVLIEVYNGETKQGKEFGKGTVYAQFAESLTLVSKGIRPEIGNNGDGVFLHCPLLSPSSAWPTCVVQMQSVTEIGAVSVYANRGTPQSVEVLCNDTDANSCAEVVVYCKEQDQGAFDNTCAMQYSGSEWQCVDDRGTGCNRPFPPTTTSVSTSITAILSTSSFAPSTTTAVKFTTSKKPTTTSVKTTTSWTPQSTAATEAVTSAPTDASTGIASTELATDAPTTNESPKTTTKLPATTVVSTTGSASTDGSMATTETTDDGNSGDNSDGSSVDSQLLIAIAIGVVVCGLLLAAVLYYRRLLSIEKNKNLPQRVLSVDSNVPKTDSKPKTDTSMEMVDIKVETASHLTKFSAQSEEQRTIETEIMAETRGELAEESGSESASLQVEGATKGEVRNPDAMSDEEVDHEMMYFEMPKKRPTPGDTPGKPPKRRTKQ